MAINRWWASDPGETFWMETTGRADIGSDLKAPQLDDKGVENPGYVLVQEPAGNDVVFHYDTTRRAIIAWSLCTGTTWAQDLTWAARGTFARAANVQPYNRPGWWHGLDGPYELSDPVTLEHIRSHESELRQAREALAAQTSGSLYFPFELSTLRPPRATQYYMSKFPAALVRPLGLSEAIDGAEAAAVADEHPVAPATATVGERYIEENEGLVTRERDPFAIDPTVVDRALQAHRRVQNELAARVRSEGLVPLRPRPTDPKFDLAWNDGSALHVVEVKSLLSTNEEQQLRLGLGQVLRYGHLLQSPQLPVRAVLAVEREPSDPTWEQLCNSLGVSLTWPERFSKALPGG